VDPSAIVPGKSSTGLEENLAAALTYVLGFITGIVFLVIEKDSRFVRFHAMQSTVTFLALWVLSLVVWTVPLLGWAVGLLMLPVTLIIWLVLIFKAYQGERYKLPIVGDIAEKNI
jgi:uncharacterized membrane protein